MNERRTKVMFEFSSFVTCLMFGVDAAPAANESGVMSVCKSECHCCFFAGACALHRMQVKNSLQKTDATAALPNAVKQELTAQAPDPQDTSVQNVQDSLETTGEEAEAPENSASGEVANKGDNEAETEAEAEAETAPADAAQEVQPTTTTAGPEVQADIITSANSSADSAHAGIVAVTVVA